MSSEKNEKLYKNIQCNKGCCLFRLVSYDKSLNIPYITCKDHIKKSGCFMYDSLNKKVLLVQSRGQLWGPPKGSVQDDETPLECAIREVKEETGLDIDPNHFLGSIIIKSKALYYFMDVDSSNCNLFPQDFHGNDANGIGWVQLDCLFDLIQHDHIQINKHCKLLIQHIFKIDVPEPSTHSISVKTCLLHTLVQSKTK
jgi:8-oxo-dGTP pyrophosphatase MutT (NUDIX family)